MSRNLLRGLTGAATAVVLLAGGVPAAAAATPTSTALFYQPANATSDASGDGTVSGDWAGWDITGGTYTSVSASWTEPTVTCAADETSYSAYWVGLDGDGSESVEQIGTSADCDAGTPRYSAWYEFYPASSVPLPQSVQAGDRLTASVKYSATTGEYTLVLTDSTQKWTKTVTGSSPQGSNASAEVIAEAPSGARAGRVLPLANFEKVTFSDVTVNGKRLSSTDADATKINMASAERTTMATTSALTAAGGFSVTWVASGANSSGSVGGRGSTGDGSTGSGSAGDGSTGSGSAGDGSTGWPGWPGSTTWPDSGGWPDSSGWPGSGGWTTSGGWTSSGWPDSTDGGGWWQLGISSLAGVAGGGYLSS